MESCIYQSTFYNLSGYAAESRGLVRELALRGLAVRIEHKGPRSTQDLTADELVLLERLETTAVDPTEAVTVVAQPLIHVTRPPGNRCVVLRTMFETDRIQPEWVENCDQFDEVWVPSVHNRVAFIASGVPAEKVRVVRGGIDTDLFAPGAPAMPLDRRKDFAFLSVLDWHTRKGWDLLVSAYCQEFRPDEPVTLYLKVHDPSRQAVVISELQYFIRESLQMRPPVTPEIVVIDSALSDREMAGIYAAVDAFVLPTRGEGYGRPFLEAMACGLPVIATNWSGQVDFLDEASAYPLPVLGIEPVPEYEPREWYRGLSWARPDLQELRRLMRRVFTNRDEAARKGRAARLLVVEGWSVRRAAQDMAAEITRLSGERGLRGGNLAST